MRSILFFVAILITTMFGHQVYAYEFSWLGLNIIDNVVSIDKRNWSTKTNGLLDIYDTLDGAPGSHQTVFVNRLDRSAIDSITIRTNNVFPKRPTDSNWWIRSVSPDGVITCNRAADKIEAKNHCIEATASQCKNLKKRMAGMTRSEIGKCSTLIEIAFENHDPNTLKKLKSTLNRNIPEVKELPFRKTHKLTLYDIQTACSEYFQVNPEVGGRSAEQYIVPAQDDGVKTTR